MDVVSFFSGIVPASIMSLVQMLVDRSGTTHAAQRDFEGVSDIISGFF